MSKFKKNDLVNVKKPGCRRSMWEDYIDEYFPEYKQNWKRDSMAILSTNKKYKFIGEELDCSLIQDLDSKEVFIITTTALEAIQPKQFIKADLKDDDKITLVSGDSFYYKNGSFTNYFYSSYDDELKRIDNLSEREIARIERPTNYETVYERVEKPARKMTVADIQKELGYKVEIVE